MTETLVIFATWAIAIIVIGIAALVLYKMLSMDLSGIIQESGSNKASLSRFQFLIFTFVIAGLYLVLCVEAGYFIEIPNEVLGLLGISSGSYVVSKGISGKGDGHGPVNPNPNQNSGNPAPISPNAANPVP